MLLEASAGPDRAGRSAGRVAGRRCGARWSRATRRPVAQELAAQAIVSTGGNNEPEPFGRITTRPNFSEGSLIPPAFGFRGGAGRAAGHDVPGSYDERRAATPPNAPLPLAG